MVAALAPGSLALLSLLVFFAGVVDALAGGGGIITLPAYLAAGLPPALVLGTNKLASSIGTTIACVNYQRKQRLPLLDLLPAVAASLAGAYLGARLAILLPPTALRPLMLAVLPVLAFFLYTRRGFGRRDESELYTAGELAWRGALVALPIGVYDGFFGPGTGTFLALAFTRFCGYDLLGSTVRAKFLNLATNLAALAAFLVAGRVHVHLGLMMGAMSLCGNYVGSHLGLRRGAAAIRPAVIAVCGILFVKLLLG